MIEPLRPEIESAQANLPPSRPAAATPGQSNGGRINFPSRPSIQPSARSAQITILPDRSKFTGRNHIEDRLRKDPENKIFIDAIPVPLCWGLLGISAAILLIEIWNYIS